MQSGPEQEQMRRLIDEAIKDECSHLTKSFLREVSPLLRESDAPRAETELEKIFETIGKLAYKFWTQKTTFITKGLRSNEALPCVYSSRSREMEPHDCHVSEYQDHEDGRAVLNGLEVLLVVHPGIIRKGDQDGLDPERRTVLMEPVVLLG